MPHEIDDDALDLRLFPVALDGTAAPRTAIDWRKVCEEMKRRRATPVLLRGRSIARSKRMATVPAYASREGRGEANVEIAVLMVERLVLAQLRSLAGSPASRFAPALREAANAR